MIDKPTRILVKGFSYSGSGAVIDLLREYQGVCQIPGSGERVAPAGYKRYGEFNAFRNIGMIGDQIVKHEGNRHPDVLTEDVDRKISKLMQALKKQRIQKMMNSRLVRKARALMGHPPVEPIRKHDLKKLLQLNQAIKNLSADFENHPDKAWRISRARQWIDEVVALFENHSQKAVIFDQPINFGQFDDIWPAVFAPYKLIIVCRDPRDQIAEQYKVGRFSKHWGHLGYVYGWDLQSIISFYIDAIMSATLAAQETISRIDSENVMVLRFEDIVLDYERSRLKIQAFIGLGDHDHTQPKMYFDPDWSRKNIGIHREVEMPIDPGKLSNLIEWYQKYGQETQTVAQLENGQRKIQ